MTRKTKIYMVASAISALGITAALSAEGDLTLRGEMVQGSLIVGQALTATSVEFNGRPVPLSGTGKFVFGFAWDAAPTAVLDVYYVGGRKEMKTLSVRQRDYEVQRIDGLPPSKVSPDPVHYARLNRERRMVKEARSQRSTKLNWSKPFVWPTYGPVTGSYGSQRILNGKPKQPHWGVDVAAPEGTPVRAPAGGKIVLAQSDFYYEGGIVMIEHGYGVTSVLMHLASVDVDTDTEIRQGQKIGTVGSTGRATGPHLDWRVNWGDVRIDAALLVSAMPSSYSASD